MHTFLNLLIAFADGDLITILDGSDLTFAIQCSRILKIQILMNSNHSNHQQNHSNSTAHTSDLKTVKTELRQIRDQINKLLDQLDYNAASQNVPELNDKSEIKGIPNIHCFQILRN